MILSLFYLALSLFGLGFLIFIHEYGHYYIGKKMGMKVETFSIGFGKPIKTWKSGDVVFQLGAIPFGGYVKFKGLDGDRSSKDGFYSVPFYKRIFVAFAGPLANLLLALFVFIIIYLVGGRSVEFAEKNPFVGYLRKEGVLYKKGLREGDRILTINGKTYESFQDFMVEKVTTKAPLDYKIERFGVTDNQNLEFSSKEGGFLPGNFVLFEKIPNIVPREMAYLKQMGLELGDRLLTINGQYVFSKASLVDYLQEMSVLCHIERNGEMVLAKALKMSPQDIKLSKAQNGEITDWKHSAGIKDLEYYIPYDLSNDLVVEGPCQYLNQNATWQLPEDDGDFASLMTGDRIVAVSGIKVSSGDEFLKVLNENTVHVIAEKRAFKKTTLADSINDFLSPYTSKDFEELLYNPEMSSKGSFIQFNVPAIRLENLKLSEAEKLRQEKIYQDEVKRINAIKDPKARSMELKELENFQKKVMIGGIFVDQLVKFNPSPFHELKEACMLTFRTIGGLVKGGLSPKQLSGPVAIVGVMQHGAKKSVTEGLYYFAVISINLALFNLLPLPVLDGGHICFALYEGITRKPVPQKVMERLTFIFVVILVALIIYATYNDILKFFRGFF